VNREDVSDKGTRTTKGGKNMIQPSALNLLIIACMIIIIGFLFRQFETRNSENAWGQAAATIY
jgi:hypothetical protein